MKIIKIEKATDLGSLKNSVDSLLTVLPVRGIISIDGPMQSGKSTKIAKYLSETYNAKILSLDSFIEFNDEGFCFKSNQPDINESELYIADGILNQEILSNFGLESLVKIYVKKMAIYGWTEQNWLDSDYIKEYEVDPLFKKSKINNKIYEYHQIYNPYKNVDIVVEISEEYVINEE